VRVLEFGLEAHTPFLVMSYAPHGTLRQQYPRGTQLPLPTLISYTKQVADALQYAHHERLIHRDIKPENMLLGRHHEVLLSDFGIALIAQSSRYQHTQDIIGTVTYMAPEQLQGKPRPASDQYSLGIVVYEWLSGDCPFQGALSEVAAQHLFVPPPPLRTKKPEILPSVEEVVLRALAKDPQQRFLSVQAFANALDQATKTLPRSSVVPPTVIASPSQWSPSSVQSQPNQPLQRIPPGTQWAPPAVVTPPHADTSPSLSPTRKWIRWIALFGFLLLVISSAAVYVVHTSTPASDVQPKTPAVTHFTSTATSNPATPTSVSHPNRVRISDASQVLHLGQVQSEAEKLPYPLDIYTTNTFTGTTTDFDQRASSHVTSSNLIVIAIDTIHRHLAIVGGAGVPLSESQYSDAIGAFKNNFNNGDYTGATIASIRSLRSSLGVASVIRESEFRTNAKSLAGFQLKGEEGA
jgi:serine/threonine protein kinase